MLSTVLAEPEPKKYKPEVKPKAKEENSSLTDEERKFLREVEAKFGIKVDVPVDKEYVDDDKDEKGESETTKPGSVPAKLSFPAVIAIEIVNDTDVKNSKGKRTIDANLGYGYQTNNGYTYTYFGKSAQEKGKFMIYPYSQEDIPPANPNAGYSHQSSKTSKISPNVEITPSQAYELVPTNDEQPEPYNYDKPAIEFKTKYEEAQGVETPPPLYPANANSAQQYSPPSTTLYTTYNGEHFSGLSGQFPQVMSNYLVDPTQLLKNPQYQNVGLTQDHLRTHGEQLQQRVVPVLVLRIPSSYIRNPSAELYANLPQNYPLSQHLNNVNLQELVNQYFKKLGFTHAPQVMSYPSSPLAAPSSHLPAPVSNYEPQHYASPYVQPSYTHADYSGVQYSAVQPVMARYPSGYTRQHYYITRGQMYQQPQHQQYVYRYRYVPQTALHTQNYYSRPQYEEGAHYQVVPQAQSEQVVEQEETAHETPQAEYGAQQPATDEESHLSAVEYETHQDQNGPQYEHHTQSVTSNYENVQTATPAYETQYVSSTPDYGHDKAPGPEHGSSPSVQVQYEEPEYKEPSISVFPRGQTGHKFSVQYGSGETHSQSFGYQNQHQSNNNDENDHGLALSENYPSKDHTIATVLPLSYKTRKQNEPIQSVSYVTPVPTVMKYHSHYRVMVPQTVLRHPTDEKVSYVNSHSLPTSYGQSGSSHQYNSEDEYSAPSHYIPPVGKQKPPSYPRNYHSHPKRMVRPESKSDTLSNRKQTERSEKKKSS